ncbi:MAG: hypothetical protein WC668_00040 [Patescibacteria group bacterium]|jgi:hypothetical protein
MKKFGKPELGYTGGQIEEELFAEVNRPLRLTFEQWLKNRDKFRMSKSEMFRLIKENQPAAPTTPDTDFAYDTQSEIVELLQKEEEFSEVDYNDLLSRVKFFTAVNSPLDYGLGIDAFFEIYLDDEHFIRITLDAAGWEKGDYKADILIVYPEEGIDPKEDKKDWKKFIQDQAQFIVEKFKSKLKNHEVERTRGNIKKAV